MLVHDEANLKILDSTAPFKGTDHEWQKEQWLKDNREKIEEAYRVQKKRPLVLMLNCYKVPTMH